MAEYLVTDNDLTTIADAIRAKSGITEQLSFPGGFVSAVENISSGGGSTGSFGKNDVTFIDYDGTILYSYSLEEANALTELPELPSHEGLICQGWNWTLSDIRSIDCPVTVGANYITDDGATRLHIRVSNTTYRSVSLYIMQLTATFVNWGDGSTSTISGSNQVSIMHTYNNTGDYVISIIPGSSIALGHQSENYCVLGSTSNTNYLNMLQSVFIGEKTRLVPYSFYNCISLKNITFPSSISMPTLPEYAFQNCYSLESCTIPSVTSTIRDYAFKDCRSLTNIALPHQVTSIQNYVFYNCYSLDNVSLPRNISNVYPYTFYNCSSLKTVTIPRGCYAIAPNAFQKCYSMQKVIFQSLNGGIHDNAFGDCYTMRCYDFSASTVVPNLSSTNAFTNISVGCQILVPSSLYSKWKSATNWSVYANYMVAV